ncbi:hypothetical protein JXA88_04725 [Candidatus Fermentibacteria bacterium]|nr:hypothetical protein [Candidatus Fermentibacteria bacterium]
MDNEHNKPLKVGLLMDSTELPAWAFEMLKRIVNSDYAAVSLIVLNGAEKPRQSILAKFWRNRRFLLYMAYERLDRRLFRQNPEAFEPMDAEPLLTGVARMTVTPRQTRFCDTISDEDNARIEPHGIDVFLRFGFRILKGRILQSAQHGIWSFHHGDNRINRGAPPGFWEVMEHHPTTGSVVQVLTPDLDNGVVLCRSYSATDQLSVNRNCNNYYWKSLSLVPRLLEELRRGPERFRARVRAENRSLAFYSHPLYVQPSNAEFLPLLLRHWCGYARSKLKEWLSYEQWILLCDLRDDLSTSFRRYRPIVPPRDRFWADPHVIHRDGNYYIFFEEFLYGRGKGHVSVMVMDEHGAYGDPVRVLERPYHLSYPFVFEWRGQYYMIPESMENGTIEAYRCVQFPREWEFCANLMTGVEAVDATLLHHGARWWLFANMKENRGASIEDELFLFSADTPLSEEWTPHPQNPIVSDVRRARPAGRIFLYDGQLYRPSQDGSMGYGYGIRMNKIVRLDEEEYEEREVDMIEPRWNPRIVGVHTFAHADRLSMIDGRLRRRRLPPFPGDRSRKSTPPSASGRSAR